MSNSQPNAAMMRTNQWYRFSSLYHGPVAEEESSLCEEGMSACKDRSPGDGQRPSAGAGVAEIWAEDAQDSLDRSPNAPHSVKSGDLVQPTQGIPSQCGDNLMSRPVFLCRTDPSVSLLCRKFRMQQWLRVIHFDQVQPFGRSCNARLRSVL